jgi:hypothetical protein
MNFESIVQASTGKAPGALFFYEEMAKTLGKSVKTLRNLQALGLIEPTMHIGRSPAFEFSEFQKLYNYLASKKVRKTI